MHRDNGSMENLVMTDGHKRVVSTVVLLGIVVGIVGGVLLLPEKRQNLAWLVIVATTSFFVGHEWRNLIATEKSRTLQSRFINVLYALGTVVSFWGWLMLYPVPEIAFVPVVLLIYIFLCFSLPHAVLPNAENPRPLLWQSGLSYTFGLLYIGAASACFYIILSTFQAGGATIAALVLIVALADTTAYIGGKRWGKRQLCPSISPGKTWFGAIFAIFCLLLFSVLLASPPISLIPFSGKTIAMVLSIGVFSMIGDIFISLLKRKNSLKDTGTIIPGHGGILDRLDGHIFVLFILFSVLLWSKIVGYDFSFALHRE